MTAPQENATEFLSLKAAAPTGFGELREALGKGTIASDWGSAPLGSVVHSLGQLTEESTGAMVTICEPWEHVGHNAQHEEVRASVNVAYLANAMGLSARVLPLWSIRCGYPTLPTNELVNCLVKTPVVFEGGAPDVYDESTFHVDTCSRNFLWDLMKRMILSRHVSHMQIYICLSHQMAASTLVELIKDAVEELARCDSSAAKAIGDEIERIGALIQVTKQGKVVAAGYRAQTFATARNEYVEAALFELHPFVVSSSIDTEASEHAAALHKCCAAHAEYARGARGVIQSMMEQRAATGDAVRIAMFHGVEVNEEAMLFTHWALDSIASARETLPSGSWLRNLPVGVEIIGSTKLCEDVNRDGRLVASGEVSTDVACMRFDYCDDADGTLRHSYSCQFHPELTASLRDARHEVPLGFSELQAADGQRMLAHILAEDT